MLKLSGTVLPSPSQADVSYRLEDVIGEGAHGVVFLALQRLPQAAAPVVVKLLRPRAVRELAGLAGTAIGKEVAALKRLSERVPPTPFVVQFLDAGTLRMAESELELPWLAVEYIHGGLEGTTLRSRVERALSRTGVAFDLSRARSAIKSISSGLMAIHEVGVLHRDVTPGNVLCCGFGETEVFKIADFGLARVSSASTFGNVLLGTPGYCAPEQSFPEDVGVGPYSDVFGLACTIYFLLTGAALFTAPTIPEMLVAVQSPERRSVLDARGLCQEIRDQRALCLELDRELARATRADPRERQQSAAQLASALSSLLAPSAGTRSSLSAGGSLRRDEVSDLDRKSAPTELRWTVRRQPGGVSALCSVGWDSNGHFLAASRDGLVYWDGAVVRNVPFDLPWVPRVVRRSGAGRWLLAGDHGVLVDFAGGKGEQRVSAGNGIHFTAAAGGFDDMVVAAANHAGKVELWAWIHGRFMEPLEIPEAAALTSCAPLTDTSWLFAGTSADGAGLLVEFRPLGHRSRTLAQAPSGALLDCATQPSTGAGLIAGRAGHVARLRGAQLEQASLPQQVELTAVALDLLDRPWLGSTGTLWTFDSAWRPAWSDPAWASPFVGILADVGRVVAVSADGAIVQAERAPGGFQPG